MMILQIEREVTRNLGVADFFFAKMSSRRLGFSKTDTPRKCFLVQVSGGGHGYVFEFNFCHYLLLNKKTYELNLQNFVILKIV